MWSDFSLNGIFLTKEQNKQNKNAQRATRERKKNVDRHFIVARNTDDCGIHEVSHFSETTTVLIIFSPESKDLPLAVLAVLSHYFSESVVTVGLLNGGKRPTTQAI